MLVRDQNLHLFKHSCMKSCPNTCNTDFKTISNGFKNNYYRRKIAEILLIKQMKPFLNVPDRSCKLKMFNNFLFESFFQ